MSIKEIIFNFFLRLGYRISREKGLPSISNVGDKVTYLDVGSSGGLPEKWRKYYLGKDFDVILVEPDTTEVDLLRKAYPNALVIPHALGRVREKAMLNVTQNPACSSILQPNDQVLSRFPVKKWFEIKKRIEVSLYPFETLATEQHLTTPDFVKLDVQGFESEVIEGFGQRINDVLCIELESHLKPIYKGQKTLEQIVTLLDTKGFFLRHLVPIGIFEDEALEFDAFFVRKDELTKSDLERKKIKFWSDIHQFPNGSSFKDWDEPRT